jgi:uncharacterized protein (DUF433 family)
MATTEKGDLSRITVVPGQRSGQPCIRGLRVTVWDVLDMLASGMSEAEILQDYSYLEKADFPAVYAYAARQDGTLSRVEAFGRYLKTLAALLCKVRDQGSLAEEGVRSARGWARERAQRFGCWAEDTTARPFSEKNFASGLPGSAVNPSTTI